MNKFSFKKNLDYCIYFLPIIVWLLWIIKLSNEPFFVIQDNYIPTFWEKMRYEWQSDFFHFLEYFILTFLSIRFIFKAGLELNKVYLKIFSLALIYAISNEIFQLFVPGRNASLVDLGFDFFGILAGISAGKFVYSKLQWKI